MHGSCYSYLQWRQSCWWKNYAILAATADCYHVSIPLPKSFDICILQLNIKKTFDPDDFNIIHFCGDDIPTYLAWMHNLYFTFLCSFLKLVGSLSGTFCFYSRNLLGNCASNQSFQIYTIYLRKTKWFGKHSKTNHISLCERKYVPEFSSNFSLFMFLNKSLKNCVAGTCRQREINKPAQPEKAAVM